MLQPLHSRYQPFPQTPRTLNPNPLTPPPPHPLDILVKSGLECLETSTHVWEGPLVVEWITLLRVPVYKESLLWAHSLRIISAVKKSCLWAIGLPRELPAMPRTHLSTQACVSEHVQPLLPLLLRGPTPSPDTSTIRGKHSQELIAAL